MLYKRVLVLRAQNSVPANEIYVNEQTSRGHYLLRVAKRFELRETDNAKKNGGTYFESKWTLS